VNNNPCFLQFAYTNSLNNVNTSGNLLKDSYPQGMPLSGTALHLDA
jgi:hypothetical protein